MNQQMKDNLTALRESCEQAINHLNWAFFADREPDSDWVSSEPYPEGGWDCTTVDAIEGFEDMRTIVLRLEQSIQAEIARARTSAVDELYMATQDPAIREHIRAWQTQYDPAWHPDTVTIQTKLSQEIIAEIIAEEQQT